MARDACELRSACTLTTIVALPKQSETSGFTGNLSLQCSAHLFGRRNSINSPIYCTFKQVKPVKVESIRPHSALIISI